MRHHVYLQGVEGEVLGMNWRPVQAHNAIERVRLSVKFKQPIPARLVGKMSEQISTIRHDARLAGPQPRTSVQLVHDGISAPKATELQAGWQYVRTATNGAALEALVCERDSLIYETAEYQRWEVFKRRLRKVTSGAFDMAFDTLDIGAIALEYFDRFVFDGPADDADASLLLPKLTGRLHPDALSGNGLWHHHTGWFENSEGGKILVNQNYDAQDGLVPGSDAITRSISMLSRAELQEPSYSLAPEDFEKNLEILHNTTKMYFKDAINPDQYNAVGIQ